MPQNKCQQLQLFIQINIISLHVNVKINHASWVVPDAIDERPNDQEHQDQR